MGKVFDPSLILEFIPTLVKYLGVTLEILVASIFLGTIIGIAAAIPKLFHIPIVKQLVTIYISFIRGTPIIIQLFLVFYGLPAVLSIINIDISRMDALYFVVITYSLSNGAIFAEIFRGAISAVEFGQTEAAYSIGMTPFQNFTRIVFPQAIRVAFPNIANTVIGSLKDTSLAFTIGVMDMMGRGETIIAATAHALEVYIALSVVYYGVVLILEKGFKVFEKYANRYQGTDTSVA
ncbi:amino acid ABC transporter permease [Psychrobacillus lasiicapitis]|uniref:Amino acid ABC transporter permease n=1 Tax=Psychrobacillus lasiicapitis TaxID=1636719 RepID=A0A544SWZ8_9BACI|nr:amino acid ABC transporter permease [Psychrobacillus lasiicapitis]TQR09726.1 amino acid ABC transporter permease [Psychrobacillus lasiicapitis]GGA23029.1 L-cystine transport system permease protein TcyL [Psychrobacillus lasiicapitis]